MSILKSLSKVLVVLLAGSQLALAAMPAFAETKRERALMQQIDALWLDKKRVEAEVIFRTLISEYPDDGYHRGQFAKLLWQLGKFEESYEQSKKSVEQDPMMLLSYYMCGENALELKKYDEAVAWYEKYLALDPLQRYKRKRYVDELRSIVQDMHKSKFKSPPGTYLAEVTGKGNRRWPDSAMPIKVYVESGEGVDSFKEAYKDYVRTAFEKWGKASDKLSFRFLAKPGNENIRVSWRKVLKRHCELAGITIYSPDLKSSHIIKIKTKGKPANLIELDLLHEVGHALGLMGHSLDSDDLMYFKEMKANAKLSKRDLATLKSLYEHEPYMADVSDNTNTVEIFSSIDGNTTVKSETSPNATIGVFADTQDETGFVHKKDELKPWKEDEKQMVLAMFEQIRKSAPLVYNAVSKLDPIVLLRGKKGSEDAEGQPGHLVFNDSFFKSSNQYRTVLYELIRHCDIGNRISYDKDCVRTMKTIIERNMLANELVKFSDRNSIWTKYGFTDLEDGLAGFVAGNMMYKREQIPKAVERQVIKRLLIISEEDALWCRQYVKAYKAYYAKKYSDAIEAFEAAARMDPDNANVHLFLANTYIKKGDHHKAFNSILKCRVLLQRSNVDQFNYADYHSAENLSYLYQVAKRCPSEARALLDLAIRARPLGAAAYRMRAPLCLKKLDMHGFLEDNYRGKGYMKDMVLRIPLPERMPGLAEMAFEEAVKTVNDPLKKTFLRAMFNHSCAEYFPLKAYYRKAIKGYKECMASPDIDAKLKSKCKLNTIRALIALERYKEANKLVNELLTKEPKSIPVRLLKFKLSFMLGDSRGAVIGSNLNEEIKKLPATDVSPPHYFRKLSSKQFTEIRKRWGKK